MRNIIILALAVVLASLAAGDQPAFDSRPALAAKKIKCGVFTVERCMSRCQSQGADIKKCNQRCSKRQGQAHSQCA